MGNRPRRAYRLGAGPPRVHLRVKSDWSLKTLYDVIAKLPGTTEADEWVIRGNHHDAWVNGAQDPISGLVAELEEARALGSLYQQGWRPKRTIIYAAWDGEEPGLLGSTEWVEAHADELRTHAVAYLNSDTNSRGYLEVEGSHSLEKFINGVSMDVPDPESGVSSWKRVQASRILNGPPDARRDQLLADLAHLYGPAAAAPTGLSITDWATEPFTKGYLTHWAPGDLTAVGPLHGTHEPPFYVCGSDHWLAGYMEGAVRTGRAAAAAALGHAPADVGSNPNPVSSG